MSDERFEGYDRVTDVLSPFSGYGKIDPMILERAAARGDRVHKAIDEIISDLGNWISHDGIEGYMQSFYKFWDAMEPFILSHEQRYFSKDIAITGKIDLLAKINGKRVLIDWKTSSQFNHTWPLQGAAYALLLKEQEVEFDSVLFVKLLKNGNGPDAFEFDPKEYSEDFNKCLWAYRKFFKNMKIPTFED